MATRRGIGYVRVSRVNGRTGDSFLSPQLQRDAIERLAAAKDVTIVAWEEDLDESGGDYNRPGFQSALERCEAGEADIVLVAKLTRFARSISDTHKALERLERAGAGLACADVDVDVTTAHGKLVRDMLAAIAAFEFEIARENWLVAQQAATANGKFPGRLPLGYRRTTEKRVEVDPKIAPAIVNLFHGRAEGLPYTALAEQFTRTTRVALHPRAVHYVLGNRGYLGELESGQCKLRVDPIVSPGEWQAAQAAKAPRPKRSKVGSLLAGILVCGSCGRPMSYRGGKVGQYTCQRFANGERCPAPVLVAGEKIDALVEERFLARHAGSGATGEPADDAELAVAERELEVAVADLQATLSLDLGGAAGDALAETIATKTARVEQADLALADLRSRSRLETRLENIGERWQELDLEGRRRLLAAAIDSVTVQRVGPGSRVPFEERASIVFAGELGATNGADPAHA